VLILQRALLDSHGPQPLGARTLHEFEVVRVVDDASSVGVLPVNADGERER
jgi:hypothetical protein